MSGKILAVWCHGIEQKGYLIIKVEEITIINSFKVFSCEEEQRVIVIAGGGLQLKGRNFSFNIFSLFSLMGFLEHISLLMEQSLKKGRREEGCICWNKSLRRVRGAVALYIQKKKLVQV